MRRGATRDPSSDVKSDGVRIVVGHAPFTQTDRELWNKCDLKEEGEREKKKQTLNSTSTIR